MPVQYPAHLYVRVDRRLREDLAEAAGHAGQSVSAFARGALRIALAPRKALISVTVHGADVPRADDRGGGA